MRTDTPPIVRLADYRPSDFLIDRVELDVRLHPTATRVGATLSIRPNPAAPDGAAPLVLDGDELALVAAALDGRPLGPGDYALTPSSLSLPRPPRRPFTLALETEINPTGNTKLMGLYRSNGVYCTQCEPEGFRRITYFLDRPDVLAVYTTRIEAARADAPVLLGNGNPVESGAVAGTDHHYAVWHDPFPKPCYLFAVVGGALGRVAKTVLTGSGRPVAVGVYVEPGKEDRAAYALDAVERSMRWDERAFGREYDLDAFNVVAVSDFNMGAMENKGLNVFNDKYVLASPETATDGDYAAIETIIAHEYFHNWTGNRITCRDWFQLCLKEGLTVFRDQEFSSDERSRAVHRIAEVRALRARQFPEDSGPLAHPVRPTQYREINNFYTSTVYEKGAEIVRMLRALIGGGDFRRGMDLYFARCDGTAATVEDFLACFAEVSGRDLTGFARWYAEAGTPRVAASGHYDPRARTYRLDLAQSRSAPTGTEAGAPLVLPVALGLVAADGGALEVRAAGVHGGTFVLEREAGSVLFEDVASRPVPSLFRGFSAPVRLTLELDAADLLTLLRHDTDPFNRWQAAQTVAMRVLLAAIPGDGGGDAGAPADVMAGALAEALDAFLRAHALDDPAFAALVLALPGDAEVAQEIGADVDPDRVHAARRGLRGTLGRALAGTLTGLREALAEAPGAPFSPDAASAGRRALRNAALDLLAMGDPARGAELAAEQFDRAGNMTDRIAALAVTMLVPGPGRERAAADFRARYRDEPLVLDKWFALQAGIPEAGTLGRVRGLMDDPAFALSNPNRVRALIGSFGLGNPTQFHRPDGAGYDFVADAVLALDALNPQVAARLLTAFGTWRTMEPGRRGLAQAALARIAAQRPLSPDVSDIAQRSLGNSGA